MTPLADHSVHDRMVAMYLSLRRDRRLPCPVRAKPDSRGGCRSASDNRSKPQGIHDRDRPRAHSENVTQNAAHTGRRALKRLDKRRMVMRLDLEGARPPVPNIDDPGVLSRPLQHALAPRRQPLQMHARRLVGAVLTPHHAEDAQFGEGWFPATEKLFDLLVFVRRKSVLPDGFQRESRSQKSGHWRNYYCRISPRGGGNKSVCSGGRIRPPAGACTRHPKDGVRLLSPDSKPDPGSKINRQGRISDHFVVAPIQRIFDVDVRGHMRIHFVPTAEICANVSGSMINAEPEEITVG